MFLRVRAFAVLSVVALSLISLVGVGALPRAQDVSAGHAGGMDAMSIDMDSGNTPANTANTIGTREDCRRINENNSLDADETAVDSIDIDVTAGGVPPYSDGGTAGTPRTIQAELLPTSTSSTIRKPTSPSKPRTPTSCL